LDLFDNIDNTIRGEGVRRDNENKDSLSHFEKRKEKNLRTIG